MLYFLRAFFFWMGMWVISFLLIFFFFYNQSIVADMSIVPGRNIVSDLLHTPAPLSPSPPCIPRPDIHFFMYHYIRDADPYDTPSTQDLSVSPALFEAHMQKVRSIADTWKIMLMIGEDFERSIRSGCFPGENVWIFTADDGWSDSFTDLAPIATRYQVPFFLGIIAGDIGKKWFVTSDEVVKLSQDPLITIASHSLFHEDHSKLSFEALTSNLCESKQILEKLTLKPIFAYVYPSGRLNHEFDTAIEKKCGYSLTWSTGFGKNYDRAHPSFLELNRTRIHSDTPPDFYEKYIETSVNRK